jgi:predicted ATP-grasp superfamily ATP-dependent carboligase
VGFFSRYPQKRVRHRDPRQDPSGFLSDLLSYVARGDYDVLIPILDVSTELISQYKEQIEKYVRVPVVDYPTLLKARDKSQTMKIAQSLGIPCPKTYFPGDVGLESTAREVDYPVLIKPNCSAGSRGINQARDPAELKFLYPKVAARYGPSTVQEYIPHSGAQYNAQFFLSRDHEVKATVVCKKMREYPLMGGPAALNCTLINREIIALGTRLLQAIKWSGYAEIDFVTDPRDGVIKVLEINPRISNNLKISFAAGINFANLLLAHALDQEMKPAGGYREGVCLRNEGLDLLWFVKSKQRLTASPSWFRFLGKNLQYHLISLDDPGPMVAFALANLRDLFSREMRRSKFQKDFLE